ncbi:hypothetical protein GCM10025864_36430 [Luteimicrobium album]|uniref:Uncharacterized protein n=1 Tax=Luteimicrobium album TaxID=1054550 RepID=A0ABQ6I523_9MICO|nr:hypothetical protein [Luteimicrobium album]GMA25884.1 hypothetical protein GCM10025864_36430 [Luteimicrobium album]
MSEPEPPTFSRLRQALTRRDRTAVGAALRDGPVLVPHLTRPDGTPQVRVFPSTEGAARPFELCLFSSAGSLEAFLGDDPGRELSVRRRESLAPFLRRHGAALARVVVDPGGPDPMTFGVTELLALLATDPADDDPTGLFDGTGAGISPAGREALATSGRPGGSRGVGIELHLPDHWAVLDPEDPQRLDGQVRELVAKQTAVLGDQGVSLRRELRTRIVDSALTAASAGAQVVAYLALPGTEAALALGLTLYWHDLGPETGRLTHLRRLEEQLAATARSADALSRTETLSGPFLRRVRHGHGAAEVGGADLPLLQIDYWAEAPGRQSVARLSFSSPHVELQNQLLALTDKVLFATEWLMSAPADVAV